MPDAPLQNDFHLPPILPRTFYTRDTVTVARDLLGKLLVHRTDQGIAAGTIIEAEAYCGPADPACHAAAGKTPRTMIFWGDPGMAYVYLCYGLHACLNVITEPPGTAGCVLIRALAPVTGIQQMISRRGTDKPGILTDGPGKLTAALAITTAHNGTDLTGDELFITESLDDEPFDIITTPRIGITKAADAPLRFVPQVRRG